MSRPSYKMIALFGFVSILLHSNLCVAQNQIPFNKNGTIISIIPGQLIMKTSNAGPIKIKYPLPGKDRVTINGQSYIGVSTTIKIEGKLHSSRIVKGMYVRFFATMNDKFVVTEEIKKLDIIDGTQGSAKPGIYPAENAEGADSDSPKSGAISYLVVAKISNIARSGEITFSVPKNKKNRRGRVKGTISEDADISLKTDNLNIVMAKISKVKFEVKVSGSQMGAEVLARDISINFPSSYAQPIKSKKNKITKKKPKKNKKPSNKDLKEQLTEKDPDKKGKPDQEPQSTTRKKNSNPKVIIIN